MATPNPIDPLDDNEPQMADSGVEDVELPVNIDGEVRDMGLLRAGE